MLGTDNGTAEELGRLPRRGGAVVDGLPRPFAESLIDYPPRSVAWWRDRWLVSATAWGGRDLASLAHDGTWERVAAPPGWARQPMTGDDSAVLSCVLQDPSEDNGSLITLRDGTWHTVRERVEPGTVTDWDGEHAAVRDAHHASALGPGGHPLFVSEGRLHGGPPGEPWSLPLPAGGTVTLISCSPSREHALVVVRSRSSYQAHVFRTRDGVGAGPRSCREILQPVAAWLDDHRVVLVRERWPSLEPFVWDWSRGAAEPVWESGAMGTVRSVAASPRGEAVFAASTTEAPRGLYRLDTPGFGLSAGDAGVRAEVVANGDQPVPCLVHDPPTRPRATCVVFPGGPHEPVWSEYAPLVEVLTAAGWRVVKVNVRSSGLREPRFRPRSAFSYGVDDVGDACAAAERLAVGPVVTFGMSYGGYVASSCAELVPNAVGAVVLAGFVSPRDVADSGFAGVRAFTEFAFGDRVREAPRELGIPHFIAHGELDDRIPVAALEQYRGNEGVSLLPLPGEGHGIHTDSAARAVYPHMLDWMEEAVS